jgi:hypothetical protein
MKRYLRKLATVLIIAAVTGAEADYPPPPTAASPSPAAV